MNKICMNGTSCKFLKAPKGCKFAHPSKEELAPKMYSEIMYALKQANCSEMGHSKNIGGRITSILLNVYSYSELLTIIADPRVFAENIYTALDVLEDADGAMYIPV